MKIFISQPMNGKTNEDIIQERENIKSILDEKYDDYLWTLSDIQYEEKRMSELEEEN